MLAKWIYDSNRHDPATCTCASCFNRRLIAFERAKKEHADYNQEMGKTKYPTDEKVGFVSTADLRPNMLIHFREGVWRVIIVRPGKRAGGLTVELENRETGRHAWIPIAPKNVYNKYWQTRPPDWKSDES
jgi:hypothetical protein